MVIQQCIGESPHIPAKDKKSWLDYKPTGQSILLGQVDNLVDVLKLLQRIENAVQQPLLYFFGRLKRLPPEKFSPAKERRMHLGDGPSPAANAPFTLRPCISLAYD